MPEAPTRRTDVAPCPLQTSGSAAIRAVTAVAVALPGRVRRGWYSFLEERLVLAWQK